MQVLFLVCATPSRILIWVLQKEGSAKYELQNIKFSCPMKKNRNILNNFIMQGRVNINGS
ncbi:MAG: hypothetical protein CVV23_02760 [Ignavibacteriae bacterium HGW-Ignavibacteriae-2]|jgi:hypothetical protein|nr:MAG: hypothetical protein CVV23_02760 [Ignavibacteriae bacterium HGW-Ignavibacteriae-2]